MDLHRNPNHGRRYRDGVAGPLENTTGEIVTYPRYYPTAFVRVCRRIWWLMVVVLAGCGGSAPEPCRNLVENPTWEKGAAGWNMPRFAKVEGSSVVVEGHAEGAISQWIQKPKNVPTVVALGYARVETATPLEATDEDVTPKLWEGAVALANAYGRRWRGMDSPHVQLRFTGREAASGAWKRFVTLPVETWRARALYPHFAFWGAKLAPGVKLRVAGLALVPAAGDVACPSLPAPQPVLESAATTQFEQDLEPDGVFQEPFTRREEAGEWILGVRYRQGTRRADRFLVAVTEDGSDPRLSATSRVQTILAHRGQEQWETTVAVRKGARPVRIAVAAAARTSAGLRAREPVFPGPWQRP